MKRGAELCMIRQWNSRIVPPYSHCRGTLNPSIWVCVWTIVRPWRGVVFVSAEVNDARLLALGGKWWWNNWGREAGRDGWMNSCGVQWGMENEYKSGHVLVPPYSHCRGTLNPSIWVCVCVDDCATLVWCGVVFVSAPYQTVYCLKIWWKSAWWISKYGWNRVLA